MNQRIFAEPETVTRQRSRLGAATAAFAVTVFAFTTAGLAATTRAQQIDAGIRPARPGYCWTRRDYSANPDRFRGGCDGGPGIFQVEGVCHYYDGGPYSTGQSIWYWAPHASPWFSCPADYPLVYTVRLDFTRP